MSFAILSQTIYRLVRIEPKHINWGHIKIEWICYDFYQSRKENNISVAAVDAVAVFCGEKIFTIFRNIEKALQSADAFQIRSLSVIGDLWSIGDSHPILTKYT